MARPKTHTPEVRERLVARALEVARDEGIGALALRSLAESAGTSTTAVYALFGGKDALKAAVLASAFNDFAAAQEAIPATDDPVMDIAWTGASYIQWAVDHPRLYEAMFGETASRIASTPELDAAGARAFACVHDAVRRAQASGAFRPADEATVVTSLWAQVHGLASLMIAGLLPAGADPAVAAFATIDGWRAEH